MKLILHKELFNDFYLPFVYDYDKRYEVFYGGAGSGKSHFLAQKLIIKALKDTRKILVARKVGKTVKNSVFQLLLDTLIDWKIINKCQINRSDFTITLPNGSVFLCTGVDDVEKLKSITGLTDAWLEEATEFTQEDFNQIDLRIRHPKAKNQQIYLSLNPISKSSWCYKLFFADDRNLGEWRTNVAVRQSTYRDNPHLPQSYIDSLLHLKEINETYYRIYALGEFGSLNKLVFENWDVTEFDFTTIDGELCVGCDFGFSLDPTAIISSIVDEKNKEIWIFDEVFQKGLLNDQIASILKHKHYENKKIIADSAEQKSIEEIKRCGIHRITPAAKGQGSVLQGIQLLQQYKIHIHPSCVNIIEEFQNYAWTKDKASGEYINKPVDLYNHGIDALRYSMQCLNKKLKTANKQMLGL